MCWCRHFADNWVVAWGPGFRSDLAVEWESFRAARTALGGVVTTVRARDQAATFAAALPGLRAQLASFLLEGKLKVGGWSSPHLRERSVSIYAQSSSNSLTAKVC